MNIYVLCVKTDKGKWRPVQGQGHLRAFTKKGAAEHAAKDYIQGKVEAVEMKLSLVRETGENEQ